MTVVVGLGPHTSTSVLRLAGQLARDGQPIVLCGVVLDTWEGPSLATGLDPHWRQLLLDDAQQRLDGAREVLPAGSKLDTSVRVGPSVPAELLAEAEERGARTLVIGSSRRAAFGRVALGSVSDQLMHSATLPVALTPSHYGPEGPQTIQRLVLGVQPGDASFVAEEILPFARLLDVPVELVTFSVSPWPENVPVDDVKWEGVFEDWRSQVQATQDSVAVKLTRAGVRVSGQQLIDAYRWSTALDRFSWRYGDLLTVCSSRRGPVARVFLGSTAARILRHTPVPTVVLPRAGE